MSNVTNAISDRLLLIVVIHLVESRFVIFAYSFCMMWYLIYFSFNCYIWTMWIFSRKKTNNTISQSNLFFIYIVNNKVEGVKNNDWTVFIRHQIIIDLKNLFLTNWKH